MTRPKKSGFNILITHLCIWSVRNQSWLAGQVRIYIFMVTAIIAFLAFAGVIALQTALFSSFCFGLIVAGILWTLIQQRKSWLLNLEDPELRGQALAAMRSYIYEVQGLGGERRKRYAMQGKDTGQCVDCQMP